MDDYLYDVFKSQDSVWLKSLCCESPIVHGDTGPDSGVLALNYEMMHAYDAWSKLAALVKSRRACSLPERQTTYWLCTG